MAEEPGAGRLVAGRYRLVGPLGRGGMGVVWRARDEVLGREVAVKEVRAPAGFGAADERRLYTRLEREAWATARISHRNVVTVHDVATEEGRPWIVMELVRGLTLAETLSAEGPMPPRRAAHIGAEVLAALRAAHGAGVLHRDVKPGNVLLGNDGRVVLTDFGIAVVAGAPQLTVTGELVGSPEYLAPERAVGRAAGPASDLWSLGVLLYAAVEGGSPFRRDGALSTLRAVVDEPLPPPLRAGALGPVIERLLCKEPEERPSAAETERLLHLVAAGGAPRADAPTTPDPRPPGAGAADPDDGPGAYATPSAGTGGAHQGRSRALLVAGTGVVLLVLLLGGLAYVMFRDDGSEGTGGDGKSRSAGGGYATERAPGLAPSAAAQGTEVPGTAPGAPGTAGAASSEPGGSGEADSGVGAGGSASTEPAQWVRVHVSAVRDRYRGVCPVRAEHAPSFVAAIVVGRVPASVEYRWATASGESSGGGWATVTLGAEQAGVRRVEVRHTELTYRKGGTHEDRVQLEVRGPVHVHSAWVPFTVTCEEEPSPGGSSPGGGSSGGASPGVSPTGGSPGGVSPGGASPEGGSPGTPSESGSPVSGPG
ncbi:serine/threonine-protein kinase [Streptomyces coeruleoprunus]|uniref:non-specific serine/threonine protein kinase n=1 Tax=Streptomyces coeruleoprunus TaxID=285563 RepID=A0ABV9XE14_9ACTN